MRWATMQARRRGSRLRIVAAYRVRVLDAAATDGSLIVVGNRGLGGFGSLLLGATGLQLATHASNPVVVVRGNAEAAPPPPRASPCWRWGPRYAAACSPSPERPTTGCARNPDYLVELAAWTTPPGIVRRDGVPRYAFGPARRRLTCRCAISGSATARRLARSSSSRTPTLVVLFTPDTRLPTGSRPAWRCNGCG